LIGCDGHCDLVLFNNTFPFTETDHFPYLKEDTMDSSVYKVIEVVGMSEKSWEEAAKVAIETVDKTVRDIRIAEVVNMDMRLEDNRIVAFRTRLKVSFKFGD
jgi:flavin-binding protein dodecin